MFKIIFVLNKAAALNKGDNSLLHPQSFEIWFIWWCTSLVNLLRFLLTIYVHEVYVCFLIDITDRRADRYLQFHYTDCWSYLEGLTSTQALETKLIWAIAEWYCDFQNMMTVQIFKICLSFHTCFFVHVLIFLAKNSKLYYM